MLQFQKSQQNSIESNIDFLDLITILSFVLQLKNNDELHKQSTNDEVIKRLHDDVMMVLKEIRELSNEIIKQNECIIRLLGGKLNAENKRNQ